MTIRSVYHQAGTILLSTPQSHIFVGGPHDNNLSCRMEGSSNFRGSNPGFAAAPSAPAGSIRGMDRVWLLHDDPSVGKISELASQGAGL